VLSDAGSIPAASTNIVLALIALFLIQQKDSILAEFF
jgi:hypothetical protein